MFRRSGRFALFGILFFFVGIIYAQSEECQVYVENAIQQVDRLCKTLERNQVCYGNALIGLESKSDGETVFNVPGDIIPLIDVSRIYTYPMRLDDEQWGIAVMKVQAAVEGSVPGQAITFLLLGDVSVDDVTPDGESTRMQAFYFSNGIGVSECRDAPDTLVVQNPSKTVIDISVNGIDISLGSTAVILLNEDNAMEILLASGQAEVRALDKMQVVPAGEKTLVKLSNDGDLKAVSEPSPSIKYDVAEIKSIPFNLLPDHIVISTNDVWTSTGIQLVSGQNYAVLVSGRGTTCRFADCPEEYKLWVPPSGIPDSECGDCEIIGTPEISVIGRVGIDGNKFYVGGGGVFTAANSGELFLGVNDGAYEEAYADNGGRFYAIVTVQDS